MRLQYGEIFVEKLLGGKQTGMQVEKISCNSCGAPLEVAETTQFATCRHCGAKLSIQRTDTATFTEAFHNWVILGQKETKRRHVLRSSGDTSTPIWESGNTRPGGA
jgi:predicted RNA-binding Zn-ribbon protein involved in translation (DUF1610 family)